MTDAHSEPCQTSEMEYFTKIDINYFCKTLYLRCLLGFWKYLCMTFSSLSSSTGVLKNTCSEMFESSKLKHPVAGVLRGIQLNISKSNRSQMFFKTNVSKNFTNFTGKHLCWSFSLIKLQAFRSLLKRDCNARLFSYESCKNF